MDDVADFSNVTEERPSFVTHLECSATGTRYEPDRLHGLSDTGKPLLVRYDLEALAAAVDREALAARPSGLWRYREFLPVRRASSIVSLGETATPLVRLEGTEARTGSSLVVVKDEGLFDDLADRLGVPLEVSPLLRHIFEDGRDRYGSREWSPNIIRRLEDATGVEVRAPGFPPEMVDDEPEEPGSEVAARR